jgi:hypothetical protein
LGIELVLEAGGQALSLLYHFRNFAGHPLIVGLLGNISMWTQIGEPGRFSVKTYTVLRFRIASLFEFQAITGGL